MKPGIPSLTRGIAVAAVAFLTMHAGSAPAQIARNMPLKLAGMELDYRGPEIAAALKVQPGATVVTFGLTGSRFLHHLMEDLGPGGTVISVSRNVHDYYALRDSTEYGSRLQAIFAKDGDSHLEVGSADLMVMVDLDGFYQRWEDMLRQAKRILPPGGRLALLQLPPREVMLGQAKPGEPTVDPARLSLEAAGFRWVEAPRALDKRRFNLFQKPGAEAASAP